LLVLDEAKDFVPSRQSTVCKASLLRLAAQARKYGLGLIFASQEPQSIDHYVVASCATQIYGKAGSQPAIERVRSQMQERGGRGDDIARLSPGQFYVSVEGNPTPVKTGTPLCLSWHPATPLAPDEVLERARIDVVSAADGADP
jgi:DNA helicase HerA-like ATPase